MTGKQKTELKIKTQSSALLPAKHDDKLEREAVKGLKVGVLLILHNTNCDFHQQLQV